jgi:hypothetical protein
LFFSADILARVWGPKGRPAQNFKITD